MGRAGLAASVLTVLGCLLAPSRAAASDFVAVYNFGVTPTDAASPYFGLTSLGGVLFGTSALGGQASGSSGLGAIFRFDPSTGVETVEYSFSDGGFSFPGRLLALQGQLYGTTALDADSNGRLFSFDTKTRAFKVLHTFSDGIEGYEPTAELTYWKGYLYGMTSRGGLPNCPVLGEDTCGTAFRIDYTSGRFEHLYAFANLEDGITPTTGMQRLGRDLYGATATTIVALDLLSERIKPVHRFAGGADAGSVSGNLVAFGSMLYGVTVTGGVRGEGALFALDPTGGTITILHSFTGGLSGKFPSGTVSFHDGKLYGSTKAGGRQDKGLIFCFDPWTGKVTTLHDFAGLDGAAPNGDLLFLDGAFYGTTQQGGTADSGVIYRLTP